MTIYFVTEDFNYEWITQTELKYKLKDREVKIITIYDCFGWAELELYERSTPKESLFIFTS